VTRDPERMTAMVERLVRVGVLTPEEGRMLASDIFNREFRKIGDDWVKRPITLTLAGIQGGASELLARKQDAGLLDDARKLLRLREELENEEKRLSAERMALARRYMSEDDVVRIEVPSRELASWFEDANAVISSR
jgi:polyhydroxyalkanoate synthesis regulator phasin